MPQQSLPRQLADLVAEAADRLPGLGRRRALHVGHGTGPATLALADSFERCDRVDLPAGAVEAVRPEGDPDDRCHLHVHPFHDLALFADDSFDFAYADALGLLEWHYSTHYVVELLRVIVAGGAAIFHLPEPKLPVAPSAPRSVGRTPLPDGGFAAGLTLCEPLRALEPGQPRELRVRVRNLGDVAWHALSAVDGRFGVKLGNHWRDQAGVMIAHDDGRAELPADLGPSAEVELPLVVRAPGEPGVYTLELDVLQEGVAWFASRGSEKLTVSVEVAAGAASDEAALPAVHPVARSVVADLVARHGGRIVEVVEDGAEGGHWRGLRYLVTKTDARHAPVDRSVPTPEEIRAWIEDDKQWPTADSYTLDGLVPCWTLRRREEALARAVPPWFRAGEPGEAILSVGTGKAYFDRKYWGRFRQVYVLDPSDHTRLALDYFPLANAAHLGRSLFEVGPRLDPVPKYGWFGASIHYLFDEFHGWEFMRKLAMMVSDTLVIDAGVFDADTPHARHMLRDWAARETFERYRLAQFSYAAFRETIRGLWDVEWEGPAGWIEEGRRTLVLKRRLPPGLQLSELGTLERVGGSDIAPVYRTREGYYKECWDLSALLVYDTVSKVMGWDGLLRWAVYEGRRLAGFVLSDRGDEQPVLPEASEQMYLSLLSWLLPLGMLPTDVARQNLRVHGGRPVWVDIDVLGLRQFDARAALWSTTSLYKEYRQVPRYIPRRMYEA